MKEGVQICYVSCQVLNTHYEYYIFYCLLHCLRPSIKINDM